ncbi:YbjQ family protein [Ensifer sp. MJa1]|uniref:YbjQ family protein n=1 Tax=Ensifer sp. MJa1 TaxID=2919888 RepID=UPI003008C800
MPYCRLCEFRCDHHEYDPETRLCRNCQIQEEKRLKSEHPAPAPIVMATTPMVPGREITECLGIVSAQVAFGQNIFKDIFTEVRDLVGGRAKAQQKVFADSRKAAFDELTVEARNLGADAVVGIDLDFQELAGGGKYGMLLVVVTGTAVKLAVV